MNRAGSQSEPKSSAIEKPAADGGGLVEVGRIYAWRSAPPFFD
jgi:hypothetical protein